MYQGIQKEVYDLLSRDQSGHGADHVDRVSQLALRFAEKENADKDLVTLIALLHDVDDYKIFGDKSAENLTNAKKIMRDAKISQEIQTQVLVEIQNLGFSKFLAGIRPTTLEGKIVSDADMCDGLGAHGILRTYAYNISKGQPFFDRNIFPNEDTTAEDYKAKRPSTSVCHIFEKILKLKDLMLTESGRKEAEARHEIVVEFLRHFFAEENAPEWVEYLERRA